MKTLNSLISIFLILFLLPGTALCHKVILFAWVEDGMIHVEGSFGSGRPAKKCRVTVSDDTEQTVQTGLTDDEGRFSFPVPGNTDSDLVLTLEAGTGHKGSWRISKDELKTDPSRADVSDAMAQKESLEKSPGLLNILAGLAVIFALALLLKVIHSKKKSK